jgi:aryl-alcohol dehydrogenase-like predicted oxidoreductase
VQQRDFGKTALRVSVLGLGTAEIGFQQTELGAVDALLGEAADAGINVLDTAAMYLDAESTLGRLIGGRREKFLLFTKCGRHAQRPGLLTRAMRKATRPLARALGATPPEWQPHTLMWNIDQSLQRLRTDRIDLMQLHSCSEELLRRGDVIQTLQRARDSGKIRYIGYSGDAAPARWATESGYFDAIQLSVNIADQQPLDDVLPRALARGLGVIAKRPIANAIWKCRELPSDLNMQTYWNRLQALDYPLTRMPQAAAVALRFTLSSGAHTAIVGTTNAAHLRANVATSMGAGERDSQYEHIRARWMQVAGADWVGQM